MHEEQFKVNQETWNTKVDFHAMSDFYDMQNFKKGKSSLSSYELKALGNVEGKTLMHLQCHFGQDTMSFQRLGAQCTGVDFSDKAIDLAKSLNDELDLKAKFVCCNVLSARKFITEEFDIVFTSYGVIGWLPELKSWAKVIAESLKNGGTFYMVEFHPIVWMFEYLDNKPVFKYPYTSSKAIYEEYKGTYADQNANMMSKEYGWNHSLSDVISALLNEGLTLQEFEEHDESPYNVLPDLIQLENGMYVLENKLYPLLYSLKFVK